ncbi:MAG: cytochrome c biogenesis protein CcdA, partial [Dehalococcoidia bacterium]|nr:cytochrome c biogenesis protein CcdA [Dehalococcoidia bacterium]
KDIVKKEYLNDAANRKELQELNQRLGLPPDLQGHITTVIDDKVIFEGHVPKSIMTDVVFNEEQGLYTRIAVYQDDMHGIATTYKVWAWRGEMVEYSLATPVSAYFDYLRSSSLAVGKGVKMGAGLLLPVVIGAGLLDGINPCAFAVMAFLVAFLFTIRRTRTNILQLGTAYILAMYATYFLIGLGLLKVLVLAGYPHVISRAGAGAVVVLGLVNLKDYLSPNLPFKLSMPMVAWGTIKNWIARATLPSTLIAGALVGLCTLPCSGGIYVAILGLLTSQTSFAEGLGYLAIYNLMYVAPLVVILLMITTRPVAKKLAFWERAHTRQTRLFSGLVMVLLGAFILWAL